MSKRGSTFAMLDLHEAILVRSAVEMLLKAGAGQSGFDDLLAVAKPLHARLDARLRKALPK